MVSREACCSSRVPRPQPSATLRLLPALPTLPLLSIPLTSHLSPSEIEKQPRVSTLHPRVGRCNARRASSSNNCDSCCVISSTVARSVGRTPTIFQNDWFCTRISNFFHSPIFSIARIGTKGHEAFRWARAKVFNSNKTSVGRVIVFGCATRCPLSVHSLAMPRSGPDDVSHGGGGGGRPGVWGRERSEEHTSELQSR